MLENLLGEELVNQQLGRMHIENWAEVDYLGDSTPDAWFGKHTGREAVQAYIRRRTVKDRVFHTLSYTGKPVRDTNKLSDFIKAADDASDLLFCLLQTTAGQPARIPRMSYLLYKNLSTARRGVYVTGGRVFLQGHWDKNRGQGHSQQMGIRFPCRETGALLLLSVYFLRPLYNMATSAYCEAMGLSEPPVLDKFFLLHRKGRRAPEDHLRNKFKQFCSTYFGTHELGVMEWRQVNKAVVRQHCAVIMPVLFPEGDADEKESSELDAEALFADMAGHTKMTAMQHYGRPAYFRELLNRYQAACAMYQALLQLLPTCAATVQTAEASPPIGNATPQQTLNVMKQAMASQDFQEMLTRTIADAASAVLAKLPSHGQGIGHPPQHPSVLCISPSLTETVKYLGQLRLELGMVGVNPPFRSTNQLSLLHALLTSTEDCLAVLRVGGGKSTLLNLAVRVRSSGALLSHAPCNAVSRTGAHVMSHSMVLLMMMMYYDDVHRCGGTSCSLSWSLTLHCLPTL